VYLGIGDPADPTSFDPSGTGFVVSMPNKGGHYLVTADHVARKLGDGGFCVRLNRQIDGLAQCHHFDHANWIRHPTEPEKVDIAVLEFGPPAWCEVDVISYRSFLTDFKMESKKIGPGDLVYVVGLFQPIYGRRRNMPTVNTGHVALIPEDELLPVKNWLKSKPTDPESVEAAVYLVQVQNTLPGISGAPAFVRRSIKRRLYDKDIDPNPLGIEIWNSGSLWLLGVWTDAWFDDVVLHGTKGDEKIPAGMGAVVPTTKLIEVLEHPMLVQKRNAALAEGDKARMPSKGGTDVITMVKDETLRTMLSTPPRPREKPRKKKVTNK
jgi:hypothetical protein